MIRIWTPAGPDDDGESSRLRGLIEHIGSGDREAFRNAGELLAFLKTCTRHEPKEVER